MGNLEHSDMMIVDTVTSIHRILDSVILYHSRCNSTIVIGICLQTFIRTFVIGTFVVRTLVIGIMVTGTPMIVVTACHRICDWNACFDATYDTET